MTTRFNLPDVGEGLEEAEVLEWLVAPGDVVTRDQPLVEILTVFVIVPGRVPGFTTTSM